MSFDDLLALVAAIISLVLLIFANFKIFTSSKKTLSKISLFLLTLFLALPFWYLIQFVVTFTLARTIPQNKIVNCIYLNEENCKKRPDCTLSYPIGGLGREMKPICIYKSSKPVE
jgi:hypothetical protein